MVEPLQEGHQSSRFGAGYVDYAGVRHDRRVELWADRLRVIDSVSRFRDRACLRWRLVPGEWQLKLDGRVACLRCDAKGLEIRVDSTRDWSDGRLVEGWESRHYLEKTALPVLELSVDRESTIRTEVRWAA